MRALIISVDLGDPDFLAHAEEFAMLAGAPAPKSSALTARRATAPTPSSSSARARRTRAHGGPAADIVLFDQPLSPAQQRNLERLFNLRVVDRVALILDSSATWNGCSTCAWSTGSR